MPSDSRRTFLGISVKTFAVFVIGVIVAAGASWGIQRRIQERNAARGRAHSLRNLRILALAMQMYHGRYGCFPPAVVRDVNGEPLYSGRVLLLPFLEQQELYDSFRKNKSWDSYGNLQFLDETPAFMRDSSGQAKSNGQTDYLFATGKGTIFEPPTTGANISSITDGTSNTICIIEVKNSGIKWSEPRDLDFSEPIPLPPGNYDNINLAVFFDVHVGIIKNGISPKSLRDAVTCAGGESGQTVEQGDILHISR